MSNEMVQRIAEALKASFDIGRIGFLGFEVVRVEDIVTVIESVLALPPAPLAGTWLRENQAGLDYAVRWLREQGNPELTAFNAADYLEGSAKPDLAGPLTAPEFVQGKDDSDA